jgi:hypothetical protein
MKTACLAILTVFAVFCRSNATFAQTSPLSVAAQQQGARPLALTETLASVGGEIYLSFNYREVEQPKKVILETETRGRFVISNLIVPSETLLIERPMGFFCTEKKLYVDPLVGPWRPVCFQDNNDDQTFDRVGVRPGLIWLWQSLPSFGGRYRVEGGKTQDLSNGGYKKELVFQGLEGETLKVTYREFHDTMAQPVISQELAFPIQDRAATILFRGLTISVTDITNTSIKYQIVTGAL